MSLAAPFVFVTVGTDIHPFHRLVGWIDEWLTGPGAGVRCFVQAGTSTPPTVAESSERLPYDVMLDRMREATAVVAHGGPGTIMDARRCGKLPIIVPRQNALGEHVDDHQVVFTRKYAATGGALLVESKDALFEALARALADPASMTVEPPTADAPGIRAFAAELAALGPRRGRRGRRSR